MQRSRILERAALAAALLLLTAATDGRHSAYHLSLQSSPASVVPLLSRFGTIEIHVYTGGVRAESMLVDSFSRNGSPTITLLNPVARMYTEVAVDEFPNVIAEIIGFTSRPDTDVPRLLPPMNGKVNGMAARRYRLQYDSDEWMDVWTTSTMPMNPQLRRVTEAFVRRFAPGTAAPLARIPGNPVYVELNTPEHPKFPLLQLESIEFTDSGESDALRVGKWYFKAPLIDAIFER